MLAKERPTLCWACCEWLVIPLLECGVEKRNIYVMEIGKKYNCGIISLSPFALHHDVPNCGWKIYIGDEKAIYATDTAHLDDVVARDYDNYLIEANYGETEIQDRIKEKQLSGEYCYEQRVIHTHLSKEQAEEFLLENMGENSRYEYLHGHRDKNERENENVQQEDV